MSIDNPTSETIQADNSAKEKALQDALSGFNTPPTQGELISSLSRRNQVSSDASSFLSQQKQPSTEDLAVEDEQNEEVEEEETDEVDGEEETEESPSSFDAEFKARFGVEPSEAAEVINSLQLFREETTLLRKWGVDYKEYDSRISQVSEFFETLPEDQRGNYDSVDGVLAIWNFLESNGKTTTPKSTRKTKPGSVGSTKPRSSAPKQEIIKRSDILKMSKQDFTQNYAKITQAYIEGRVIEDV